MFVELLELPPDALIRSAYKRYRVSTPKLDCQLQIKERGKELIIYLRLDATMFDVAIATCL